MKAWSVRQIAVVNKQTRYQGKPCPKGHDGMRWTGSGNCITCVKLKYTKTGTRKGRKADPAREAAKLAGEIYYISGRACKRGHFTKRRTATGCCQECAKLKSLETGRDYTLRSKYKITLATYNEMLEAQNFVCLICEKPETAKDKNTQVAKTLSVDHCHETGRVRGLLCHNCNVGIGSLKHNPKLLAKAALYCEAI